MGRRYIRSTRSALVSSLMALVQAAGSRVTESSGSWNFSSFRISAVMDSIALSICSLGAPLANTASHSLGMSLFFKPPSRLTIRRSELPEISFKIRPQIFKELPSSRMMQLPEASL